MMLNLRVAVFHRLSVVATHQVSYLTQRRALVNTKRQITLLGGQGSELNRFLPTVRSYHLSDSRMAEANPTNGYFSMGLNTLKVNK